MGFVALTVTLGGLGGEGEKEKEKNWNGWVSSFGNG